MSRTPPTSRRPDWGRVCVLWTFGFLLGGCKAPPSPATSPEQHADRETNWGWVEAPLEKTVEAPASPVEYEPLVAAMEAELHRSFTELKQYEPAPYFLSYQVTDRALIRLTASNGALGTTTEQHHRTLDVDLRIGSALRDDTHPLPGEEDAGLFQPAQRLPLKDHSAALRNAIWLATDANYKSARTRWMRVSQILEENETEQGKGPDFSIEPPARHAGPPALLALDRAEWERQVRSLSQVASKYPDVLGSEVALTVLAETRYIVNTEGTRLQLPHRSVRLEMQVETVADDGMRLERFDAVDRRALADLPEPGELALRFDALFRDVQALRSAPLIEPYVGPAILDGKAAGVFFHEVFGHRMEGHRQDRESEGQTFASRVNQAVMVPHFNVFDDPRLSRLNGIELNGFYLFDDEGVPAERANLVQRGVLREFLLSRTPVRGFEQSNGHGRREPGHRVVARQANLVIEPERAVPRETLQRILLRRIAEENLPYGLRFAEITGGFTQTQRYDTQAFKVIPVMVYKVHPDGREELVRGVDIEGTPLTALSKVIAAGNDFDVFNGMCGAESGWVPVSATSPSILVSQLEVARQDQDDAKYPILPPPANPPTPPNTAPSAPHPLPSSTP